MDRTNAERQRRYIARLKPAAKKNAKNDVSNASPCVACAEKGREIAALNEQLANEAIVRTALQERIAVLEKKAANAKRGAELMAGAKWPPLRKPTPFEKLEQRNAVLRFENNELKAKLKAKEEVLVRRPRSPYWIMRGSIRGQRIEESTNTADKNTA